MKPEGAVLADQSQRLRPRRVDALLHFWRGARQGTPKGTLATHSLRRSYGVGLIILLRQTYARAYTP